MTKYLFSQTWYEKPKYIFEPFFYQIKDYQSVSWRIDPSFNYSTYNHNYIGLTANPLRNPYYDPAVDDYLTTQIQYRFSYSQDVWEATDSIRMGMMAAVVGNGGPATAYGNFYIKWLDTTQNKEWWFQLNYFDERGNVNHDTFYFDHFTEQAAIVSDLGYSKYSSPDATSNKLQSNIWTELKYLGFTQSQAQFEALILDMNKKLGTNYSTNPNDHEVAAIGHAPELAFADKGGYLMEHSESFFFNI